VTVETNTDRVLWSGPLDPTDLARSARQLLDSLLDEPWGQTTVSSYETARLVSLTPWLTGHAERIQHLLDSQGSDGSWGGPGGYALVPTLSATEALLGARAATDAVTTAAAVRGLHASRRLLTPPGGYVIPDTPAADLIVPTLVELINERLDRWRAAPDGGRYRWHDEPPLVLPAGCDAGRLDALREMMAAGARVPTKLLHALEVAGGSAALASGVRPVPPGTVGGSPAATAAWLAGIESRGGRGGESGQIEDGGAMAGDPAGYLADVCDRYRGPVPCAIPITVFERAWVLSTMLRAGLPVTAPAEVTRSLHTALGARGAAAGAGLPPDADTTAVALHALSLLGEATEPHVLLGYRTDTHFATWPGEDGASITTNAHVLDAIGAHLRTGGRAEADRGGARTRRRTHDAGHRPVPMEHYRRAARLIAGWLYDQQHPDGCWTDRWHASPYYATACCTLALHESSRCPETATALRRAMRWVLDTQRPDGSWGRWAGTAEETAYALHVLLHTGAPATPEIIAAGRRGGAYLFRSAGGPHGPPLWHDKDLYQPIAVVRATVIAALHLVRRQPGAPSSVD